MKVLTSILFACLIFAACQNDSSQNAATSNLTISDIDALRGKMYNEQTNVLDKAVAAQYVEACAAFAKANPENSQSADLLFKAGETARSIQKYNEALEFYDWIYNKFPNHEKAPQALFLKAFTLDNDLKKTQEAKAIYESFLAKYPNDDFADDTRFLLDNLGKSDDEIIKSFETQKKE